MRRSNVPTLPVAASTTGAGRDSSIPRRPSTGCGSRSSDSAGSRYSCRTRRRSARFVRISRSAKMCRSHARPCRRPSGVSSRSRKLAGSTTATNGAPRKIALPLGASSNDRARDIGARGSGTATRPRVRVNYERRQLVIAIGRPEMRHVRTSDNGWCIHTCATSPMRSMSKEADIVFGRDTTNCVPARLRGGFDSYEEGCRRGHHG